ncbi:MAG: hypothetical protein HC799_19595 [Limnothrix sp. RL_2_0]|nr:hypothetical protein [Limnothrix sp. RL_2_0]
MTSARLNVMSDPVTSTVVSEILRVAFGQFLKAGVGEGGRQLTGAALTKADELRKKIYSWFSKAKHKKAEESIRKIEKEGEENSLAKLITYLTDEMEENPRLASELQSYITDIKKSFVN